MDITELPTKIVGMSNEDYRNQTKFDSRSFLHTVAKYGGEVQLWLDQGKTYFAGNSATAKGSEFDFLVTEILGGKQFDDLIVVPPDEVLGANGSRSTKAYKEWAANQTGLCVTADQKRQYECMLNSMYTNDACYSLMSRTVETQVSVFFELDGHLLKTRPDACLSDSWWDLKTTSQSWDKLFMSARDYGYYEQEWLYVESAKAIGLPHFRMPFVFVQTSPPYTCKVFHLPEPLVEAAGRRLRNVMEEVRLRRSTGMYSPADANEITELVVPAWAQKEEEYVEL
jgi:PDDEXK-like domain of unknown function (DUF3799)